MTKKSTLPAWLMGIKIPRMEGETREAYLKRISGAENDPEIVAQVNELLDKCHAERQLGLSDQANIAHL